MSEVTENMGMPPHTGCSSSELLHLIPVDFFGLKVSSSTPPGGLPCMPALPSQDLDLLAQGRVIYN